MLRILDITSPVPGLGPISLDVAGGECVALAGPSGSGKTRLLRAVADLDPHGGDAELGGERASSLGAPVWRRKVGLLPAESHWWREVVGEHFQAPADELARLGFEPDVLGWRIDRLSSGERQRLALLRLLAMGPRALLLDEPTANLDPVNIERVEGLLAGWRTEHAAPILWVTHDRAQAVRVASRLLTMELGRIAREEAA
jgi:ABC-type iron transport system FetAB ATPase subunit